MLQLRSYRSEWFVLPSGAIVLSGPGCRRGTCLHGPIALKVCVNMSMTPVVMTRAIWIPRGWTTALVSEDYFVTRAIPIWVVCTATWNHEDV